MLARGRRVGVAVSGGGDSVALLHALGELGPAITVLQANHHLRGAESEGDEAFVRELAQSLSLPIVVEHADAREGRGNLEERARQLRLAFFQRARKEYGLDAIACGHTRSDQAETVLFRILRGAGTTGLAGIRPVTEDGIIRPLIEIEHDEVIRWLKERGHRWREDSSNVDQTFDRNRLRHLLLPQLRHDWNPALVTALAHTAVLSQEDERYWEVEVGRHLPALLHAHALGWILDAAPLAAQPAALARRLVRAAIEREKGDLRQIDFEHVESILRLARSKRGSGHVEVPGMRVTRSFEWLLLRTGAESKAPPLVRITDEERGYTGIVSRLDREKLSGELAVRCWRPGDAYQPMGYKRSWKLKELFHLHKVPSWDRPGWPILMDGKGIVWSRKFGPSSAVAAEPRTFNAVIVWEEEQSA